MTRKANLIQTYFSLIQNFLIFSYLARVFRLSHALSYLLFDKSSDAIIFGLDSSQYLPLTGTFLELNALSYRMFDKKHGGSGLRTFLENQEITKSMSRREILPLFLNLSHLITSD